VQRVLAATSVVALASLPLIARFDRDFAWQRVAVDAAHVPVFALLAIVLHVWLRREQTDAPPAQPLLVAFLAAQAVGVLVELLQVWGGRSASAFDLGSNAAGAALGLALTAAAQGRGRGVSSRACRVPAWLVLAAAAGFVYAVWRPVEAVLAYQRRAAIVPQLVRFEDARDLYFVRTAPAAARIEALPTEFARRAGERALRVPYGDAVAPEVELLEPWPDWRGHVSLAIELANDGPQDLPLVLRIHDADHDWSAEDRLNLPVVVPAHARTTLRVPLARLRSAPHERPMDLGRIANLKLFGAGGIGDGALYLLSARLEQPGSAPEL